MEIIVPPIHLSTHPPQFLPAEFLPPIFPGKRIPKYSFSLSSVREKNYAARTNGGMEWNGMEGRK